MAAAAPLYVYAPAQRMLMAKQGINFVESRGNSGDRLSDELRAVPVSVLMKTHTEFPVSANDAKRSQFVDRHITMDHSVPRKESYLLAYTADINEKTLKKLLTKEDDELYSVLKSEGVIPAEQWANRIPADTDGRMANFKVIRNDREGHYRIEVITDMRKYKGPSMLQKGLLHSQDRGPEALYQHALPFDMMGQLQLPDHRLYVDYLQLEKTRTRAARSGTGSAASTPPRQ